MSSWAGFTDRLRYHARSIDVKPVTCGYLTVAADRIEDLEDKLAGKQMSLDIAAEVIRRLKAR